MKAIVNTLALLGVIVLLSFIGIIIWITTTDWYWNQLNWVQGIIY